jgi:hypothetical protein
VLQTLFNVLFTTEIQKENLPILEVSAMANLNIHEPFIELAKKLLHDPELEFKEKFPLPVLKFAPKATETAAEQLGVLKTPETHSLPSLAGNQVQNPPLNYLANQQAPTSAPLAWHLANPNMPPPMMISPTGVSFGTANQQLEAFHQQFANLHLESPQPNQQPSGFSFGEVSLTQPTTPPGLPLNLALPSTSPSWFTFGGPQQPSGFIFAKK